MPGKPPATDETPPVETGERPTAARTDEPSRTDEVDDEQHRRVRRRQMIAAILAIVAIIIFALIQGFLGAPSKIPGTH